MTANQRYKKYKVDGGTMPFAKFVENEDVKKSSMGNTQSNSLESMFFGSPTSANAFGKIGEDPLYANRTVTQPKPLVRTSATYKKKGADGTSTTATMPTNETFGINNYVLIGAGLVIAGAIGWQVYVNYKK